MASVLSRAKLARAARMLNVTYPRLPPIILMTDERRLPDPIAAICALPRGAAVILRHTDAGTRANLAARIVPIAQSRGLVLLIANDAVLAARMRCDGIHFSESRVPEAAHWKVRRPSWLITAAAHSARAVARAAACGVDAVLLSAPFATQSHMERPALGAARFRLIAQSAAAPVYALGGIRARNVNALAGTRLAGIAAIEALTPDQSS